MPLIVNHSGRNPVDVRRAEKLKRCLAKKNLLRKEPCVRNWILEFGRLRKYGDKYNLASPDQIDAVLKWYCRNIGKKGIPDIRSAGIFRKRFSALKKAMENSDDGEIRIQKGTRQFIDEYLSYDRWPGDSIKRLPQAVQYSADNHAIMVDRLDAMLGEYKDVPEREWPAMVVLAADILADHQETFTFILNWFNWVNKRVIHWPNWNGSFRQFIFRADHKRFSSQMFEKSAFVTGSPEAWEELLREIR